jgi:hypothetical protein
MLTYSSGREIAYRARLIFIVSIFAALLAAAAYDQFLDPDERYDLRLGWKATLVSYTPTLLDKPNIQIGSHLIHADQVARVVWANPLTRANQRRQLWSSLGTFAVVSVLMLALIARKKHSREKQGKFVELGKR